MPGRDRTGPMGYGPRTGWGAGLCAGTPYPYIPGRGFGMGYGCRRGFRGGMGMGRWARWGTPFVQPTPQEERSFLENQMEGLQNSLNFLKQRLEELSVQETRES